MSIPNYAQCLTDETARRCKNASVSMAAVQNQRRQDHDLYKRQIAARTPIALLLNGTVTIRASLDFTHHIALYGLGSAIMIAVLRDHICQGQNFFNGITHGDRKARYAHDVHIVAAISDGHDL